MITRIEIDGFKSFQNFAMDFQPFQVIIGQNGVGKSNLFDALMILSRLANGDKLFEAFQGSRGSVEEQFSLLADGSRSKSIKFAVELLLPKILKTSFIILDKPSIELPNTRYRYTIQINRHDDPTHGIYLSDETLNPISPSSDNWANHEAKQNWFIYQDDRPNLYKEDEFNSVFNNELLSLPANYMKKDMQEIIMLRKFIVWNETVATLINAMSQWQTLAPEPALLRQSNDQFTPAETLAPNASNFAALLYRIKQADEFALNDIARDMMNLNQNIKAIDVRLDEVRRDIYFLVQDLGGNWLSPKLLSDGTLRTLAYVTLRYLPEQNGVFCIEEPENSVHPLILEKVVKLFQSMTTDFSDTDSPLRQIILNTHSPALLSYVSPENIAYLYMPRHSPRITAVGTVGEEGAKGLFTKAQIKAFLEVASPKGNLMENLG